MQSVSRILFLLFISQIFTSIYGQTVQGRHRRPYQDRCGSQGPCHVRGGLIEDKVEDDKSQPGDHYRSIDSGALPNTDKIFNEGGKDYLKPDSYDSKVPEDDYDHRPPILDKDWISPTEDQDRKPSADGGGYNRKPVSYRPDSVLKHEEFPSSIHNPEAYIPQGGGGGYIPKPVRGGNGGYYPRPNPDKDHGVYDPKPEGIGGGYNPRPDGNKDGHVPRPIGDHRPKPPVDIKDPISRPIGGGGHRPKPTINRDDYLPKPVTGGSYHKEDDSDRRPIGPDYPNKDLGGYNDPKDDDYSVGIGGGIKDEDYVGEVKPKPVVKVETCICVPYYQCKDGHIVTDGAGIIDARKRPEPEGELPLDGKFNPPACGPYHVCCNTPETSTVKPYEHRCGVRNPSGINSRMLSPSNKGEADFGEWPWQAAVLKAEGKVNIFQCGGVLIDKFHVLTVAHCVFDLYKYNDYPLKVRLGEWDTQTTTEFLAHEDYSVSKIIIHPEYKNTSLWNDIAILRLEEAVLFAPHIDTICLPKYDEIFAEHNCVVTGWGKDAYKGGSFSNIMKEIALQVIDNYKCEEMLRKTRLGRFFQLHEGFLCAGGEYGLDSCKGDGGGPLVCYRKDKSYALAGIVSWGIDCGQPGVPGVYVKIQKYLEWISKNTGVNLEEYWPKQ